MVACLGGESLIKLKENDDEAQTFNTCRGLLSSRTDCLRPVVRTYGKRRSSLVLTNNRHQTDTKFI
jgi:hypothetical protein